MVVDWLNNSLDLEATGVEGGENRLEREGLRNEELDRTKSETGKWKHNKIGVVMKNKKGVRIWEGISHEDNKRELAI